MNPKTKRRLTILLAGVVTVSAAGGGFVIYRKQRSARYYANLRKEGLAAYTAGDYNSALEDLGRYVRRSPNDSEALYACAESRLHIEEPNHAEIPPAIGHLRAYVDLNPDRKDVREELLQLYLKVGFFTETINTADTILSYAPKDPKALLAKARANFYLRKYDEALKFCRSYNDVAPVDLEGQTLTLNIMQRQGATSDDIIGRADELLARHADDSRFELLRSFACVMTGDIHTAAEWAKKAAKHPDPDPAFLKMLVRQLDTLGLFAEANGLEESAARNNSDVQTRDNWINRLLQSGRYTDVVDVINKEKELDTNLLVCKTLALIHLNRTNDAQTTLAQLADRGKTDTHAAAAASAIDKTLLHPADSQAAIAACNDALSADNQDPFFLFLLAKAYDLSGETELAEEHYRQAAATAPAWVEPLTANSKLMLSQGRTLDAFISAQQARLRSPDDREALVAAVTSGVHLLPADRTDEFKNLLQLVQSIETKYPDEQRVLPVHALALARLGQQSDARAIIKKGLTLDNASPELLLSLAAASQAAKLGLEEDCFARCQQLHNTTAQLAFARAIWLAQNGHADDGLKYLNRNMPQKPDSSWEINHARYLELTADSGAKKEWEDLAEKNPNDVKIQWQALAAKSTQADRPFIAATIDRLRNLRGDKGTFLSLMRARYILQGNPSDKDLAEVILLLSDVTRQNPRNPMAHQLLASAYFAQKSTSQAVEELSQAADITPDNTEVTLELARLLHTQRNFSRARPYIDRITQSKTTTVEQRRTCAALLADEGDIAAAAREFELIPPSDLKTNDKISLASFYAQLNQNAKAEALLSDLLKQPTPEAIQLTADLYGSQKRDGDAQRVLALLDTLDCPSATKSRIRAAYTAQFDSPENAIKQFLVVTKMTPTDPTCWRQLLTVCIYAGRFDDIDHYVADAHAAIPADAGFTTLSANLQLLHALGADRDFRAVFASMIESPNNAPDIADALKQFAAVSANLRSADEPLHSLRQLADKSTGNLAVQVVATRALIAAGRTDEAVDIGSRAMQDFPRSPEAAQISAESLSAAGRWQEVVAVGNQWRTRLQNSPISADISVASAYMHLQKYGDAVRLLQPYTANALKAPDDNFDFIMLYVQALAASGDTAGAEQILKPRLAGQRWRYAWIELAVRLAQPKDSEAWLKYATESFPSASPAEKTQLALSYFALSRKINDPRVEQSALAILEPLAAKPDCEPGTLVVLGSVYESQNNLPAAEMTYRHALDVNPKQPVVLNNLAMVLFHRNSDLDEALKFANQAVAMNPNVPNFFDTLANILARKKAYPDAMKAIEQAIQLAPSDPEWQATRVWLLALSGQQDNANLEFRQLQLSKNFAALSDDSRKRLASVGIQ